MVTITTAPLMVVRPLIGILGHDTCYVVRQFWKCNCTVGGGGGFGGPIGTVVGVPPHARVRSEDSESGLLSRSTRAPLAAERSRYIYYVFSNTNPRTPRAAEAAAGRIRFPIVPDSVRARAAAAFTPKKHRRGGCARSGPVAADAEFPGCLGGEKKGGGERSLEN